jgi:hypothetical protein
MNKKDHEGQVRNGKEQAMAENLGDGVNARRVRMNRIHRVK